MKRRKPKTLPKIVERKLGRELAHGLQWPGQRLIEIDPRQGNRRFLATLIHELIHEAFPEAREYRVQRATTIIANGVWLMNYRRIQK